MTYAGRGAARDVFTGLMAFAVLAGGAAAQDRPEPQTPQ